MAKRRTPSKRAAPKKATTQRMPKVKQGAWFMPVRYSYLPASREGWLSYLPLIAAAVLIILGFGIALNDGAEVVPTVVEMFLAIGVLGIVFTWFAARKA